MPTFGANTQIRLIGGVLMQRDTLLGGATNQRLAGIKRRALNLEEPFRAFLPVWRQLEGRVFGAQGLPARWPALSPRYAAYKARRWPGKTILRRTDRLYTSLTQAGGENIGSAGPRSLRFGTRVPYWQYHQVGSSKMPARPSLVLLPETMEHLNQMVMRHVISGRA